ncbi:type III pantothenate kinase [Chlorobium phaeovibrioides]|uniref:Type III pantothenate kinase n=2 Tax=Chlorobium phaeovibrioides TaxID=1094 RepID=A0A432AVG9_CHLPH|nr:type III pantothenate kinase [Chlorobium phaeovibrioides]HCD36496.1 type III pantothenate kinase [Chlorobium sp.]KAA6232883.1 type III pantothenate kinase [Chlorobium phaeovibrioides]MWV54583.1 type III pantothenate kinase [Chlorobium phaeovibrioides]QEQ56719.1 type III pantothenate kinase [Chlorobium phaeovibrioides]RTY35370.1 type III pantothenate kinase [Chlorobium phaeovibrioides]
MSERLREGNLLLAVEIGNTTLVAAVFQGDEPVAFLRGATSELISSGGVSPLFLPFLSRFPGLCDAVLSSVVPTAERAVGEWLEGALHREVMRVNASLRLPFLLSYDPPGALGSDRIALCARASMMEESVAVIALDVGTAITADVLGSDGRYMGGIIMPGLELMADVLHSGTARLPRVAVTLPGEILGHSTRECIQSGVVWGCVSGVEGLVSKITRWLEDEHGEQEVRVIATGGHAPLLARLLDGTWRIDEHAVLHGARYLFALNRGASG